MGSVLPVFKFGDDDFFFCLRDWTFADFCNGASGDCHAGNTAVVLWSEDEQLFSLDPSYCNCALWIPPIAIAAEYNLRQSCKKGKFHCIDKFSERVVDIHICCICSPWAQLDIEWLQIKTCPVDDSITAYSGPKQIPSQHHQWARSGDARWWNASPRALNCIKFLIESHRLCSDNRWRQCILLSCQADARKTATIVWDAGSWKSWCNSSPKAQKCICSMWLRAGDCAWIAAGCKCIMYSPVVCASWTLQLLVCHVLIGCQRIMHRTRCILYSLLSMHHILINFGCTIQLPNVHPVLANPHVMSRRADRLKLIVKAPYAVLCLRLGTAASDWEIMIVPGYQVPGASYMTLPDFITQDFLLHQVVEFSLSAHLVFQPCSKPRFKVSRYINSSYTHSKYLVVGRFTKTVTFRSSESRGISEKSASHLRMLKNDRKQKRKPNESEDTG